MKKEGIQTRNRKMTSKSRRTTTSCVVGTSSSRRLFNVRPSTPYYDRPPHYYHNYTPANSVFSVQPGLPVPEAAFYPAHASGPQGYPEYSDGYLSADGGMGYMAATGRSSAHNYLSAVASSQQYLSAAAAGFHRHLHDLL